MSVDITTEETVVRNIPTQPNIPSLLGLVANYHYIYGENRSWFLADWRQDLATAIILDNDLSDNGFPCHLRTRPLVEKILANATEYSAYGFPNHDEVVEIICKQGQEILERFNRKQFKLKLAGEELEVW